MSSQTRTNLMAISILTCHSLLIKAHPWTKDSKSRLKRKPSSNWSPKGGAAKRSKMRPTSRTRKRRLKRSKMSTRKPKNKNFQRLRRRKLETRRQPCSQGSKRKSWKYTYYRSSISTAGGASELSTFYATRWPSTETSWRRSCEYWMLRTSRWRAKRSMNNLNRCLQTSLRCRATLIKSEISIQNLNFDKL